MLPERTLRKILVSPVVRSLPTHWRSRLTGRYRQEAEVIAVLYRDSRCCFNRRFDWRKPDYVPHDHFNSPLNHEKYLSFLLHRPLLVLCEELTSLDEGTISHFWVKLGLHSQKLLGLAFQWWYTCPQSERAIPHRLRELAPKSPSQLGSRLRRHVSSRNFGRLRTFLPAARPRTPQLYSLLLRCFWGPVRLRLRVNVRDKGRAPGEGAVFAGARGSKKCAREE